MSQDNNNPDPQGNNPDPQDPKTYSDEEFKKVVAQRDAIKAEKLAIQAEKDRLEAEKKALGEDELKKKGELQTLLDNKEKDLADLKKALENAKQYEAKYTDLDKSIRENLLKQLPEELIEIAEDLSTVKLQKYVEIHNAKTPGMESGKVGKQKINIEGKKWDDFNSKDLEILKESDFSSYSQLYKQRYGRQPVQ